MGDMGGGGFGGHGGGFGGHGPGGGFGGPGGGFGPHHGGWGPGFPGPWLPPGIHGPHGGFIGGGPTFAPWLGALAVGAVAASAVSPYTSHHRGRSGIVVWREGRQEMSAKVDMVTVRVCQAQNIKDVQMVGRQDPYVRARLLFNGHQIGECRSSTHVDGGRNPVWENKGKSVFTFYVPATVTLDTLAVVLDVINDNLVSDTFIGTTGSIALGRAATGEKKWWNVSRGGVLQAAIGLITSDSGATPTHTNTGAAAPVSSWTPGGSSYGGGPTATINPSPHVYATPVAAAPANVYGAPASAPVVVEAPPPSYQSYAATSAAYYRPPPVAPGAAPEPHSGGYGTTYGNYNGGGAPLPEATAVPFVGGFPGDDPFNARGAAAASAAGVGVGSSASPYAAAPGATYGGTAGGNAAAGIAGTGYPPFSAHPVPSSSYQQNQRQQQQQQQQQQQHQQYQYQYNNNARYGNL